ncbi:hypothetical protein [Xenorhabdus szentirmaii]|uniref:Phage related-protein n=1 Tax=Xenorhabdus szentirmaii DSM 16338 TaxID=1427518 RepID=W1J605_9GAMM|nr:MULTISPECIES: hypothetical protein [Xenorhabdus]MBD2822493.1 hypothetical protein [Xenorhabdus sp. 42]PHM32133.1 bacteriophage protein [Xenorhabdus szentirmaii DSM 16338]PHM41575.1 bacteriophage protein [Xenorhabdus szentirmaii]CDL85473.1 Phage related-protein [Xenorhabdus szentirmaii DSM 16338]
MNPKLAHLKRVYDELSKKQIKVGFFEQAKYPDGTSIAYVASIQEFGHGPIPPRPFIRPAINANRGKYQRGFKMAIDKSILGELNLEQGLAQVGEAAKGDIQAGISAVQTPPLSMVTLLLRKRRKQDGFNMGGKAVGEAYRDAYFVGPRRKGDKTLNISGVSQKPLVDGGLMIQSVNYAVEDK